MKRSNDRILTTHVGSLIRPQPLQEFLRARQAGRPFDAKAYDECLCRSVADVVRRQRQREQQCEHERGSLKTAAPRAQSSFAPDASELQQLRRSYCHGLSINAGSSKR